MNAQYEHTEEREVWEIAGGGDDGEGGGGDDCEGGGAGLRRILPPQPPALHRPVAPINLAHSLPTKTSNWSDFDHVDCHARSHLLSGLRRDGDRVAGAVLRTFPCNADGLRSLPTPASL